MKKPRVLLGRTKKINTIKLLRIKERLNLSDNNPFKKNEDQIWRRTLLRFGILAVGGSLIARPLLDSSDAEVRLEKRRKIAFSKDNKSILMNMAAQKTLSPEDSLRLNSMLDEFKSVRSNPQDWKEYEMHDVLWLKECVQAAVKSGNDAMFLRIAKSYPSLVNGEVPNGGRIGYDLLSDVGKNYPFDSVAKKVLLYEAMVKLVPHLRPLER